MFSRFFKLLPIFVLIISCAHRTPPPIVKISAPQPHPTQRIIPLGTFSTVDVKGNLNVILHTGYSKPKLIIRGDKRDIDRVTLFIRHSSLFIKLDKSYPKFGTVTVDIQGKILNHFNYKGRGTIKGTRLSTSHLYLSIQNPGNTLLNGYIGLKELKLYGSGTTQIHGISSQGLKVKMSGSPKVQLDGRANLTHLDIDGTGSLRLHWIDSRFLTIREHGLARVELAGKTEKLDLELWDKAQFKGRYLRANTSFVKTHGKSLAEINTLKTQHSLASDASDIYYYEIPDMQTNFMAFNGSVLDMRELGIPDIEEYDRYNKTLY